MNPADHARMVDAVYATVHDSGEARAYSRRHGVESQAVLTVTDMARAQLITRCLMPHIAGKTVVEIGGGLGYLAMAMGRVARRVYCIEANPMWTWLFAELVMKHKPKNVSFLFGAAAEFEGIIRGDVALFCTFSDIAGMARIAGQFAPRVIDVYREFVPGDAEAPPSFDPVTR